MGALINDSQLSVVNGMMAAKFSTVKNFSIINAENNDHSL